MLTSRQWAGVATMNLFATNITEITFNNINETERGTHLNFYYKTLIGYRHYLACVKESIKPSSLYLQTKASAD